MQTLESVTLEIDEPQWLYAHGDSGRIEVYRSPLVRDDDLSYISIREFIAEHGLSLAACEVVPDTTMMFGRAEASVWVR